jgi:GntR family transcriptional repressor for pyruvate dehydrogenase complex
MSLVRKSFEVVADDLANRIMQQILKPGDRLPTIDQLAISYGVGKSTIREALSQLKVRGLILAKQGEGTFVQHKLESVFSVTPFQLMEDPNELFQLLQVRRILEGGCAEIAALTRDEDDLIQLNQIVEHMKMATNDEELSSMYDIQFHNTVAKASKNIFLINLMNIIAETMSMTIRDLRTLWLYHGENSTSNLYNEHVEILLAIEKANAHEARLSVETHLDHVRLALEVYLQMNLSNWRNIPRNN